MHENDRAALEHLARNVRRAGPRRAGSRRGRVSARLRVMARVNLTLERDAYEKLTRYAKRSGAPTAALARLLVLESLDRREADERKRRLAADYVAGRADARELLKDLENGQLESLGHEER